MSLPKVPALNDEWVVQILTHFIKEELHKFGIQKAVLGLSGGIDSAVVAALCARALGPAQVLAIKMPYKNSSKESVQHADLLVKQLGIRAVEISITEQVDAYFVKRPELSALQKGNKMARERMSILYDFSVSESALVIGTSNKTELLLGYGTQYGDMASAVNPIGDLYKNQIFALARYLKIPEVLITKAPSADLWEGQTDEKELGETYEKLDQFLYYLVDERYDDESLLKMGFEKEFIQKIKTRVARNQYKRRPPVIAKLSGRTIEADFLYPRDWGV
jgi:NAD+ synthase